MIALLLARYGSDEAGIRIVIRATARTSFALFILAFVAAALRRAWRSPTSAWLLANRRYLGVSFAVSHGLHLLAILALYDWSLRRFFSETALPAIVLGGLGYVFVVAMTITSFDRTAAWLGPQRWRRLHTAGMYLLWTIFTISYVPRALMESPAYAPLALASLGALTLRLMNRPGRRRPAARVAA
jgi:sulfoxide reductase heme-binding subunit YedZ